ncbi:MAG: L,D-transpeptidase [Candidatus Margulisiibacteriota bacterium]
MLIRIFLVVLLALSLPTPELAFAAQNNKAPAFFKGLEIKANLGRTLIAVDKAGNTPVFIPIVVINKYTKISSRQRKNGLQLKPRDIIDVWTDRMVDGLYVADKIFLRQRPDPTAQDIKSSGRFGRKKKLSRFRLIPIESIAGHIAKVVVDTRYQNVYVYGENNKLWYLSRCVTGKKGWQTPRGKHRIRIKQRNRYIDGHRYGEKYRFWVNYWMLFYGEAGLHDATWRKSFWINPDYNGSHGCINLPLATAKFIYDYSKIGTPVYIR